MSDSFLDLTLKTIEPYIPVCSSNFSFRIIHDVYNWQSLLIMMAGTYLSVGILHHPIIIM